MPDRVTLISTIPAGIARNEKSQHILVTPFIGKTGIVIEEEDDAYNTDRPTGYETCWYLVDFGDEKLWLPACTFLGYNHVTQKEEWKTHLKFEPQERKNRE